ncbi:hypothetical protein JCM33374_g206 [Metschnikowia sp. JCM 33374]|nr:hypothetical protein JCM33374_g206 [Metschnikowia sp. JCM 33374]
MGKKSRNGTIDLDNESNTPPILDIGFSDPLFSTAAHPTRPVIVSGLGTGHVFCHSYNAEALENSLSAERSNFLSKEKTNKVQLSSLKKKWWRTEGDHANLVGDEAVSICWKTRRHKGSCRSVMFDILENEAGDNVFTVGTDNMLKKAKTETGKVQSKIDMSAYLEGIPRDAITTLAMSNTHPFLVSGSENGSIFVFDSTNLSAGKLKFRLGNVQEDAINKILPMPAVSAYHFLALGSTRLAHIDIRKGIISQSDDQADELLSMCYPADFVNANKNDTVIVTHGEGVITLWRNSTNGLSDQISRVKVNKNASIDAIISTMNSGDDSLVNSVWCGDSEGYLHRVDYKRGKVAETRVHSSVMSKSGAVDEVGGLDIDYEYRLVSSGMEGLKIWSGQAFEEIENFESDDANGEDSSSDDLESSEFDSDVCFSGSDQDVDDGESGSDLEIASATEQEAADGDVNDFVEEVSNASEERPKINKKKRGDVFQIVQKAKKEKIDIGKFAKKKHERDDKPHSGVKNKERSVKKGGSTSGIAKFDGL